jgi:dTDP-glucose pyrophosphorylase
MIANCDQWVDIQIDDYLQHMNTSGADGLIMTMHANDPKWSYAGIDSNGHVTHVVEKEVISDRATVGIYNYAQGKNFCDAADQMIRLNLRVKGEFYVAPAYNLMIQNGLKIVTYNVGSEYNGMHGLGTPQDLDIFLNNPISRTAVTTTIRNLHSIP